MSVPTMTAVGSLDIVSIAFGNDDYMDTVGDVASARKTAGLIDVREIVIVLGAPPRRSGTLSAFSFRRRWSRSKSVAGVAGAEVIS